MNEGYSGNRWEIGVDAAYAANETFDQRAEAMERAALLNSVEGFEGVSIDEAVMKSLVNETVVAEREYQAYGNVVAEMIGPDAPKAETAPTVEVEPVVVPEIDTETAKKLEVLPAEYSIEVATRYSEKYAAVEGYIREGKLPEAYRLPELSVLVERVVALAPTHEHMQQAGWHPRVEFIPQGLSREQWNGLFQGQKLPNGQIVNGTDTTFSGELVDPTNSAVDSSLWDVAVIDQDASLRPTYTQVSKDGQHGSNAKEALKAFKKLPGVNATTPDGIVAEVSPREDVYNGAQLSRLERGEELLDPETWTISRENIEVDGVLRSVYQRFVPSYRRVYSLWGYLDDPSVSIGVRVSASGRDLVL